MRREETKTKWKRGLKGLYRVHPRSSNSIHGYQMTVAHVSYRRASLCGQSFSNVASTQATSFVDLQRMGRPIRTRLTGFIRRIQLLIKAALLIVS